MNDSSYPLNETSTPTQSHVSSACAACKYQRRKCTSDCIFAPFFPVDKCSDFLNARRFYGVSNMMKIVKSVPFESRAETMRSIIYLSNLRAQDLVGGFYRQVNNLTYSINAAYSELIYIKNMITIASASTSNDPNILPSTDVNCSYNQRQQPEYYNFMPYFQLRQEPEGEQLPEQPMHTPAAHNPNVEEDCMHTFLDHSRMENAFPIGELDESNTIIAGSSAVTSIPSRSWDEAEVVPNLPLEDDEHEFSNASSSLTLGTKRNHATSKDRKRKII